MAILIVKINTISSNINADKKGFWADSYIWQKLWFFCLKAASRYEGLCICSWTLPAELASAALFVYECCAPLRLIIDIHVFSSPIRPVSWFFSCCHGAVLAAAFWWRAWMNMTETSHQLRILFTGGGDAFITASIKRHCVGIFTQVVVCVF